MKKLFIIPLALFLTGCFTKPETPDDVARYENDVPTNIRVDLNIGQTTGEKGYIEIVGEDICINEQVPDSYNTYFYIHWSNDGYSFYRKEQNKDWEVIVPVGTYAKADRENAINSLVGYTGSAFSELFNIKLVNGYKSNGTNEMLGFTTDTYDTEQYFYCLSVQHKMFFKCMPHEDVNPDWGFEVTAVKSITSFTVQPTL